MNWMRFWPSWRSQAPVEDPWAEARTKLAKLAPGHADADPAELVDQAIKNAKVMGALEADMRRAVNENVIGSAQISPDATPKQVEEWRLHYAVFIAKQVERYGYGIKEIAHAAASVEVQVPGPDDDYLAVTWSVPPDVHAHMQELLA